MKSLTLACMLCATLAVSAQTAHKRPLVIGVNFAPEMAYRTLSNNTATTDPNAAPGQTRDAIIDARNDKEVLKLGYTGGINFGVKWNETFTFETGIQVSNKGYKTKWIPITTVQSPDPDPNMPQQARSVYSYHYIDIPLRLTYFFAQEKRLKYVAGAGVSFNFLTGQTVTMVSVFSNSITRKKREEQGYNTFNLTPFASLGIDYALRERIHLRAEPVIRYSCFPSIEAPIYEHLWSAGLNFGCYYNL